MGSDPDTILIPNDYKLFQSTLPVWGATDNHILVMALQLISIHAPRVGSDLLRPVHRPALPISIHAPRVGSDDLARMIQERWAEFQSTLPVWGAT